MVQLGLSFLAHPLPATTPSPGSCSINCSLHQQLHAQPNTQKNPSPIFLELSSQLPSHHGPSFLSSNHLRPVSLADHPQTVLLCSNKYSCTGGWAQLAASSAWNPSPEKSDFRWVSTVRSRGLPSLGCLLLAGCSGTSSFTISGNRSASQLAACSQVDEKSAC